MVKKYKKPQRSFRSEKYTSNLGTTIISTLFFLGIAFRLSAEIDTSRGPLPDLNLFNREDEFQQNSEEVTSTLELIRAQKIALQKKEAEIAIKESSLKEAESKIKMKIQELASAEDRLRRSIGEAKKSSKNDIAKIIQLYEGMKPKQAAPVFEMMEPALAAGLLSEMKKDNASDILSALTPEKSYAISVYLAGRNAQ